MAYKQKGCTPVTAKIKKTTKGGMVQQPLLNMGAPVKMMSPAKQGGRPLVAKKENKKEVVDQSRLKQEIASMESTIENYKAKGGKPVQSDLDYLAKAKSKLTNGNKASKQSKSSDISKVAGGFFGNDLNKEIPKNEDRLDFPIKPKQQTKDPVIKRKKVQAIAPKTEAKVVSMETKSEIVLPKEQPKAENVATKKQERVAKSIENKENRAKTVRAKGEAALASGNKEKARRLKRREERILERAEKKKTQSSKAIEPK